MQPIKVDKLKLIVIFDLFSDNTIIDNDLIWRKVRRPNVCANFPLRITLGTLLGFFENLTSMMRGINEEPCYFSKLTFQAIMRGETDPSWK